MPKKKPLKRKKEFSRKGVIIKQKSDARKISQGFCPALPRDTRKERDTQKTRKSNPKKNGPVIPKEISKSNPNKTEKLIPKKEKNS